jgi:prevent-host-death family protein
MAKTQVRPSRDLRNHYADVVRSLERHDRVIITNNGVGEAVLIGFEDYGKYEEFLHHQFIHEALQKSKAEFLNNPNEDLVDAAGVFAGIRQKIAGRGL